MLKILTVCLSLAFWISHPLVAPADENASNKLSVQINFENDAFYDKDYHYTNGLQIRCITPKLYEFALGQQIYTPEDKISTELQEDDRPYAGYLYGAFARHWLQDSRMDTLELAAGVIGPSAQGEIMQDDIHGSLGVGEAKGWKHQLKDEPAIMLTLARIWRLNADSSLRGGWDWDVLPRVAVSLGTPFTQASGSVQFRFGWNLPGDFDSTYMRPGAGALAPDGDRKLSVYFFTGFEARALAWNTFLDGNIWHDSHSVNKKPCVAEFSAGAVIAYDDWRVGYTHIYRGKEFDGQKRTQSYGSLMFGYVF